MGRLSLALSAAILLLGGILPHPAHAAERRGRAEKDDPLARMRSNLLRQGPLSAEALLQIQRTAQRELSRTAPRPQSARFAISAVASLAPGAVVNVGPEGSTFDANGVTFDNVDSGRARTIVPHPTDPDILYFANAGGGVWKTFDATAAQPHWEAITDGIPGLGTGSLALDPNSPNSLILGLGDPFNILMPGVLTSDDGGISWSAPTQLMGCYGTGCPTMALSLSVRDVKFNGSSTGVALAATDLGLFRNTTGGTGAWTLVEMPTTPPSTPMDCFSVAWVGGTTWLLTCTNDNPAGGSQWGAGFLFRSTDDGASWGPIALPAVDLGLGPVPPGRMTVSSSPQDAGDVAHARAYLLASDEVGFAQLDVFKSINGGATFTATGCNKTRAPTNPNVDQRDLDVMHDQAWYNQAILADGDSVYVGGNLALVRSRDAGGTWDVVSDWLPYDVTQAGVTYNYLGVPYVHADFHALAISTAGMPVFYAGTDGGLFRSLDAFSATPGNPATGPGGVVSPTFDDSMNRGLVTHLLYTVCAGSETQSGASVILGGLQDNGSRIRNGTFPTLFDMVTGGDGIGCGVGKAGGTGAFGSLVITTYPAFISRSTNGGATFVDAVTGLPSVIDQNTNFLMQVANDPNDATAQTFLTPINSAQNPSTGAVTATIFRTTDGAAHWSNITSAGVLSKMVLGVFAHPKSPSKQIYLAYSRGRVFITTDAGATAWKTSPAILTLQSMTSAAFDPADASGNTVWVTNHEGPLKVHVAKTTTALGTTPAWTDKSGIGSNFPDVPANIVRIDPNNPLRIYVGTDIGLYTSADGGDHWARYGTGMPAVKVTDLSIASDGKSLRVATFGRGFWELYPKVTVPSGVHGNGDLDGNQLVDGVDLILEAAALDVDVTSAAYQPKANLTGDTNAITWDDMLELFSKFGGRP